MLVPLDRVRRLALSAFVLLLPFWWYLPLRMGTRAGVYFTYQSVLVYASDGASLALLALWAIHIRSPQARGRLAVAGAVFPKGRFGATSGKNALGLWLFSATISLFQSLDPLLSAAFVTHLILLAALCYCFAVEPPPVRIVARLLAIGLVVQSLVAIAEFAIQTTAFLEPLGLRWPGALTPAVQGAGVVELADGRRWLRAYGTLPHPNILSGYLLLCLAGPAILYLERGKKRWLIPSVLGMTALALTFSRAAWLGGAVGAAALRLLLPAAYRPRLARLLAASAAGPLVLVLVFRPLFLTRLRGDSQSISEARSLSERGAFLQAALPAIREHWLFGLGAGAYAEYIGGLPEPHVTPEPVHSLPLLVWAETGLGGLLGLTGLCFSTGKRVWQGRGGSAAGAAFSAALVGLAVVGLLDHFLWSLPPGRGMLALAIAGVLAYNGRGLGGGR